MQAVWPCWLLLLPHTQHSHLPKGGLQGRGHGTFQKGCSWTELCLALGLLWAPGDGGISVSHCTIAPGEAGILSLKISRARPGI